MRIAIVGAGVSGLTAAHLLNGHHEVTVFEAGDYAGGHTNTVTVPLAEGTVNVDTGFIVLNDRNYPTFTRLLERLGVPTQPSQMSFSVSSEQRDFEYAGTPHGLLAQPSNLLRAEFRTMIREYVKLNRVAAALLAAGDERISLADWLAEHRFSQTFIHKLIVPQASAVWSADPAQMWSFPALFMVRFFHNHGMLSLRDRPKWRTVAGGSKSYVEALTAPLRERLHLATPVSRIERDEHGVTLHLPGDTQRFDQVVIATHSDQALAMLADPTERERELLGSVPYQPNEAVLHTDRRLLPKRRAAWSSWNFHLLDQPSGKSTVTYDMNRLQKLRTAEPLLVTLNRTEAIDPDRIIRTVQYAHPVFTADGWAAQARHAEISGQHRTHYAGAYWRWGFHEDGVVSGQRVALALGGDEL